MSKRELYTLLAAILGSGVVFLDSTVVNIALPAVAGSLHAGYSGLQWVIDGYLLTLSAMILFGGSLGDIFGHKRIFQIGLVGFTLSSLACGLSPNIGMLTAARLVQGAFGALLVPSSLAVINTTFPKEKRATAIGRWTAYAGIFTALGPLGGGLLIALSWRWVFLINLPLALVCYYFIARGITDEFSSGHGPKLDWVGGLLAIIGLGSTTFGLIEGPDHHWAPISIAAIFLGLTALIVFPFVENRQKHPMLPLSLFKSHNFTGANLVTLGMYAALGGALFAVTLYLQTAVGYTALAAGLAFVPVTIIMLLLSGRMGGLSAKYGPRWFMTLGPIIGAAGFLLMLRISPGQSGYWVNLFPGAAIFGLGLATTVAPLTATVMSSVDESRSGVASAVNNAAARIAGLLVVAFLGIIVANQTTQALNSLPSNLTNYSTTIKRALAGGQKTGNITALTPSQQTAIIDATATAQRNVYTYSIYLNAFLAFLAGVTAFLTIQNPTARTSSSTKHAH